MTLLKSIYLLIRCLLALLFVYSGTVELLGPEREKPVVVYCGFVACTRSHNGAAWAVQLGYTNVKRYAVGIFAWRGAGRAVESGE